MITPREGEQEEKVSEDDRIRRVFRISAMDPKPVLLYFHFDHEDAKLGKTSLKQCGQLNDETVARWSQLYHCVEVDTALSSRKAVERFGAGTKPSFAILNSDLEVVAKSSAVGSKQLVTFLKTTVEKKFPEYWTEVTRRLEEQKKAVSEARTLAKKRDLDGAIMRLQEVRWSELRIGPWWDDAVKEFNRIERKMEKEG